VPSLGAVFLITPSGTEFLDRCEDDRHQFRFIVSPEDASELPDLKPFIRDLMAKVEADLGTRLDSGARQTEGLRITLQAKALQFSNPSRPKSRQSSGTLRCPHQVRA